MDKTGIMILGILVLAGLYISKSPAVREVWNRVKA